MSGPLGLLLLALVDATVWWAAFLVQEPPTRLRILGANVAVICVNVALIAIGTLARAAA